MTISIEKKKKDLISCYDSQAKHFHNTRWFHKWPELDHIKHLLQDQLKRKETCTLLDLGCWTWRISKWCTVESISHSYTWVDISSGMIETARKNYPKSNFHVSDMLSYLRNCSSQTFDTILCLASFHHLTSRYERIQTLRCLYDKLHYWWICVLVNRSYSDRFLQKYKKQCIKAIWNSVVTLWKTKRNDVHVPRKDPEWKSNNIIHHRFYHMFTLRELRKLCTYTDFILEEATYISQTWEKTHSRRESRNSYLVLRKGW